jgi:glucose uptake protein GlcU
MESDGESVSMSNEVTTTMARLATNIIGAVIMVLGLLLVYYSLNTEYTIVNPYVFTPIGVVISVIGGLMILARES